MYIFRDAEEKMVPTRGDVCTRRGIYETRGWRKQTMIDEIFMDMSSYQGSSRNV